jgi:hypothetical protein
VQYIKKGLRRILVPGDCGINFRLISGGEPTYAAGQIEREKERERERERERKKESKREAEHSLRSVSRRNEGRNGKSAIRFRRSGNRNSAKARARNSARSLSRN